MPSLKDEKKGPAFDLILIDAMNLIYRYADSLWMLSYNGKPTGMQFGVLRQALSYRLKYSAADVLFLWDQQGSRRKQMDPTYKANRPKKKGSFIRQLEDTKLLLYEAGFEFITYPGLEADDLAGWFVKKEGKGKRILLVSNDHDWYQFLGENCWLLNKTTFETAETVTKTLKMNPLQIPLVKILTGDASDNIKGVPRFPTKVLQQILETGETDYRNIPKLLETDKIPGWKTWHAKVLAYWDQIVQNAELIEWNESWIIPARIQRDKRRPDYKGLKVDLEIRGMASIVTMAEKLETRNTRRAVRN